MDEQCVESESELQLRFKGQVLEERVAGKNAECECDLARPGAVDAPLAEEHVSAELSELGAEAEDSAPSAGKRL